MPESGLPESRNTRRRGIYNEGACAGRCRLHWAGRADIGVGPETLDCDHCCDVCDAGITCGDLATRQGWAAANCESDTNNACGGQGTPTCDCNFCCEVGG